ncbi:hypothetical protein TKK_0004345 [Trichogramma kaykai]
MSSPEKRMKIAVDQLNDDFSKKLKIIREEFRRELSEKRYQYLHNSYLLFKDMKNRSDLVVCIRRSEIETLLEKSVEFCGEEGEHKYPGKEIVEFVVGSGFKDEPGPEQLDENGVPISRRATLVHRAAAFIFPVREKLIPDLFEIYDRVDVNYADETGLTHFHVACENGCTDVVRRFLEQGQVDPNLVATETGDAPLHFAVRYNNPEVIEMLLTRGAEPNAVNAKGWTPLHQMSQDWFDEDMANKFREIGERLSKPVEIDARDKEGRTPLHLALRSRGDCAKTAIKWLLERGADPNAASEKGLTPLHVICGRKYDDDVTELFFNVTKELNKPVRIDARDKSGRTPLQWAVATLKPSVIGALAKRGADLSGFQFPSEAHFDEAFGAFKDYHKHELKLRVASGFLATLKSLEEKGYKLARGDVLTIMKLFVVHGLLDKSATFKRLWREDQEFVSKVKSIEIEASLTLHDLLRLRPEEVANRVASMDYRDFWRKCRQWRLPDEHREACEQHLCESILRYFVHRWTLDSFIELTCY